MGSGARSTGFWKFAFIAVIVHCLARTASARAYDSNTEDEPTLTRYPNVHLVDLFRRMRRTLPSCEQRVTGDPELQQAVVSMFTGSSDGSYILQSSPDVPFGASVSASTASLCTDDLEPVDISPDMPLKDRALCSYVHVDNHDTRRLPQTIPEVECRCTQPKSKLMMSRLPEVRCEPMYYDVPVLLFDETCSEYKKATQRIALACVPVISGHAESSLEVSLGRPQAAVVDI
ncbi:Protein C44B12.6 [Aphelenchoides avenae]|nr:Protein C44B12.6 [Aphelenchus avenae]KAH7730599.1 Protein C44B12.6 [Aphelenchus avenae]